jgi:peptidoglycan/xylan/chitin deacetylase (PgdA/CDA1 family)
MCLVLSNYCFAVERQIAITIDDLPFVGFANNNAALLKREEARFLNILQPLIDNNVPVTGFVIAGAIEKGQWQWLEQFQQAGFVLGNHTYSHANLNAMSAKKYKVDVEKADKILAPLMSSPKYFRYPFLAEGKGAKRQEIQDYLEANNYIVAPVTVDSKDFVFNAKLYTVPSRLRAQKVRQIKPQYLAYIWNQTLRTQNSRNSKQILLIHANLLNSYCMSDIIEMYKKHGYRFISLSDALNQHPSTDVASDSFREEMFDDDESEV